jgi:hypothetical protein
MGPMNGLLLAAGLALWSAAAMTFGDWVWATLALRHRPQYGLAHGTLLCLWMGLYLGVLSRRVVLGLAGGTLVGLLAAASFYALAPFFGYSAMFLSWMLLWLGLVGLAARLLGTRLSGVNWGACAFVAALGSGASFYAVSGIWMGASGPPYYAWHFVAWTIAFLPGALAMLALSSTLGSRPTA